MYSRLLLNKVKWGGRTIACSTIRRLSYSHWQRNPRSTALSSLHARNRKNKRNQDIQIREVNAFKMPTRNLTILQETIWANFLRSAAHFSEDIFPLKTKQSNKKIKISLFLNTFPHTLFSPETRELVIRSILNPDLHDGTKHVLLFYFLSMSFWVLA